MTIEYELKKPFPERITKMRGKSIQDKLINYSEPVSESGCQLWTKAINASGYGIINYNNKCRLAHRVAWAAKNGEIPDGLQVLHRCDVRCCINTDHLFLGTNKDNVDDKVKKGRAIGFLGESNPNAKLSNEDISAIRKSSSTPVELANVMGVSLTHIHRILKGESRHG